MDKKQSPKPKVKVVTTPAPKPVLNALSKVLEDIGRGVYTLPRPRS